MNVKARPCSGVRQMVVDALRHWVEEYHVDGRGGLLPVLVSPPLLSSFI